MRELKKNVITREYVVTVLNDDDSTEEIIVIAESCNVARQNIEDAGRIITDVRVRE